MASKPRQALSEENSWLCSPSTGQAEEATHQPAHQIYLVLFTFLFQFYCILLNLGLEPL